MSAAESHRVAPFKVFAWLVVLTAVEIGVVYTGISKSALVAALIGSALLKAGIVATYFMHLKFEGKFIWGMLIATSGLALVFFFALFPDIVIGYWK